MIRVAIVEDEASYMEQFQEYLTQYAKESGEEFDIVTFTDGDEIAGGYKSVYDMPIASAYVPPAIYNLLVTFITGGVSMIIFFFVFKIIFPEGEAKKEA